MEQKEFDENPNKELIIKLLKHYHGMSVQARWPNEQDMEEVIKMCNESKVPE